TSINLYHVSEVNDEQQTSCTEPLPISENKCEKLKSCQHHICDLICHPRECQPCVQLIKQTCLSHGTEREVLCTNETGGTKTFTCGESCGKLLLCGHHRCTKTCHDGPCPDCLSLPENCKTCTCGKTIMDNQQRSSCIDPLATYEKLCERILSCGSIDDPHQFLTQCHNGPCPSCSTQLILQCRCGKSSKSISCIEAIEHDPIENSLGSSIKDVHHQCELICGKILNCRIQYAFDIKQKNNNLIYILFCLEIKCHCGETVLKPKSKCFKILRKCYFSCKRAHECGHPANHWCYNDDKCPPCTHPVSKLCVGEHMSFDVPCHVKIVCCRQPNVCYGSEPCPITTCEAIIKVRCPCGSLEKKCYL
ncbi:unnamed protein product, partial [Rotaria sp. Silwood1]